MIQEIKISDEPIGVPGVSLMQRDTNTTLIRVGWESMATPGRVYEYDIVTKEKKLVKETEIPSGHDPSKYVVERITMGRVGLQCEGCGWVRNGDSLGYCDGCGGVG